MRLFLSAQSFGFIWPRRKTFWPDFSIPKRRKIREGAPKE
jgi:hypothetical protein